MEESLNPRFSVSEFVEVFNQTVDYALHGVEVEGEVANFKISKDRWVFFDLKDENSTVPCFMTVFQLRTVLEDGAKVIVSGNPKLTPFGKFSITVKNIQLVGEGNIKKAFELLKKKLEKEGLFDPERKRKIPENLKTLGIISSVTAAGYGDFLKILGKRWGGLELQVANCGVQGLSAADEIIRAIDFFNEEGKVDMIVIVRGGGSADDLALFNDELLAKKIASSRIPILTGIGHEVDTTLADLAADVRASTPTNAAELLTSDKKAELSRIKNNLSSLEKYLKNYLETLKESNFSRLKNAKTEIEHKINLEKTKLLEKEKLLESLNPERVLKQGYSILSGKIFPGSVVKITTIDKNLTAEIKDVQPRKTVN